MTSYYKVGVAQRALLMRLYEAGGASRISTLEEAVFSTTDVDVGISLANLGLAQLDAEIGELALTAAGLGVAINLARGTEPPCVVCGMIDAGNTCCPPVESAGKEG